MSRRQLSSILLAIVLAAAVTSARQSPSNLSGTWTGTLTINGDTPDDDPAHLVLKQNGTELTGTGGPGPTQQWEILKGKVATTKEGTAVTFDLDTGNMHMQFALKLVDGRLKGTVVAERGTEKRTGTLDVGRAK